MFTKKHFMIFIVAFIFSLIFMSRPIYAAEKENTIINNCNEFYSAIKKSLSNYDSSITLKIHNYDKNVYNLDVINKVLLDNPNLRSGYSDASESIVDSNPVSFSMNFKYDDTRDNLIKKELQVEQKVTEIVNKVVKKDMKDYEKELALHDYLVNNAQYDKRLFTGNMPEESFSDYGVLIKGTGVCEGFAEAMNRLLIAAGIDSKMVVGEANNGSEWVGHAWNMAKIGGQYYQLDSTWDDPLTNDGSKVLTHTYFNITDKQISKDHKWNGADYPKCNSTTYNFNNLNVVEKDDSGNIITIVKNYNEFYSAIKNAITSGKGVVSLKVLNYYGTVYNVLDALTKISNETRLYRKCSWSCYNDNINNTEYVRVNFN